MTAADFSHLAAYAISEETEAEYIFVELVGEPSIFFVPGTEENLPFYNESIRLSVERAEQEGAKPRKRGARKSELIPSAQQLEEQRENDRVLISSFCAKRWGKPPVDKDGKVVEFSAENCLAFFRALPGYIFDPCRNWVTNPHNFVQRDALPRGAGELLGESSPPA